MKPLVLVAADIKKVDGYSWHATPETYLNALVNTARVQPLILPNLADITDLLSLMDKVDGVLLTGSRSNVHPANYGLKADEEFEPYDQQRDATTLPLARAALESGTPLLAICRGQHELNVALGGSLAPEIQEQPNIMDHRAPVHDDQKIRFKLAHTISPTPGGILSKIVGSNAVQVNSLHRQAIDRLAEGLMVEARAEDGTIEAVSVPGAKSFALSVQWHPEYWAESETVSRQIFEYFGDVVRGKTCSENIAAE